MLFNSIHFAIFFPIATVFYFALPQRARWVWMLACSAYFYMSFVPAYILILIGTIVVDYVAGLLIEQSAGKTRKLYLVMSLVANVGVLAFFKYEVFFAQTVNGLLGKADVPVLGILLPIGLSFHTFQSMSYTVEVYRGAQKAERHLGIFALYVLYYPQLVAGPIERPQNVLHQLREHHRFEYARVVRGLQQMAWGFIKKMVIADRLAVLVSPVFDSPRTSTAPAVVLAAALFAYQIYCDFSGYSDIALGCSEVMGIRLMRNFDTPYASRSLAEFWRRWHISLSTWFRDYLFIPLGGSRAGRFRTYRNLLIVFAVSGLWHGANWTFIAWGALHGAFLVLENASAKGRAWIRSKLGIDAFPGLAAAIGTISTFAFVCVTWIFFRAVSIGDAVDLVKTLPSRELVRPAAWLAAVSTLSATSGIGVIAFVLAVASIIMLEIVQYLQRHHGSLRDAIARRPEGVRWLLYGAAVTVLVVFSQTTHATMFIYFQF